jgi:hypothetical protein
MKRLTSDERELLDGVYKNHVQWKYVLALIWWDLTNHQKRDKFFDCLRNGMSFYGAYLTVK